MKKIIPSTFNSLLVLGVLFYVGFWITGIIFNHHNVPFWDEWDVYVRWVSEHQHDLGNLLTPHNEHISAFPKLLNLFDFYLGSNFIIHKILLVSLILITAKAIASEPLSLSTSDNFISYFGVLILLASWIQHENFIWANQSGFMFGIYGPIISYWLMPNYRIYEQKLKVVTSLTIAIAASFSIISAILIFPLLLTRTLLFKQYKLAAVVLGITVVLYYVLIGNGINQPAHHPERISLLNWTPDTLIQFLNFFMSLFTNVFTRLNQEILLFSAILLAFLSGQKFSRKKPQRSSPEVISNLLALLRLHVNKIGFALYFLLCLAALAYGRYQYGEATAGTSRYAIYSLGFLSVVVAFVFHTLKENRNLLLFLILVLFLPIQIGAIKGDPDRVFNFLSSAYALNGGIYKNEFVTPLYYEKLSADCESGNYPECKNSGIYKKVEQASINSIGIFKTLRDIGYDRNFMSPTAGKGTIMSPQIKMSDECLGYIDSVSNHGDYFLVKGWSDTWYWPGKIANYYPQQGAAIFRGKFRYDIQVVHGKKNRYAGFLAFVPPQNSDAVTQGLIMPLGNNCNLIVQQGLGDSTSSKSNSKLEQQN